LIGEQVERVRAVGGHAHGRGSNQGAAAGPPAGQREGEGIVADQ
jgi:hypothetical protein